MNKLINKYWTWALSISIGVSVYLFWAYPYKSVLSYQEQYQLFLFGKNYFLERIALPGGLADYIGEFLTQFYYIPVFGAAILGIIFFCLQRLTWVVCRRCGADTQWFPLSFIPALALWMYMGDENVLLCFAVSLLATLVFMWLYTLVESRTKTVAGKALYILICVPLIYWLFGANILTFIGFVVLYELKKNKSFYNISLVIVFVIYTLQTILVSSYYLQYPLFRLYGGINYYRYPAYIPYMQIITMILFAVCPVIIALLPKLKGRIVEISGIAIIAVVGFYAVKSSFDPQKYDLIEYDYLVRGEQWNKIIVKAKQKPADNPMSVSIVNLALSQREELADRLFEFYQNGAEGLFPSFTRDMVSPVSTSEIFFRLGMINDAERYAFEAQEAIPNHRKSGRLTKRIIDCEIINGHYGVARKHLKRLKKSMYYDTWAEKRLAMLKNEEAINNDPIYGKLRAFREKKQDFLFSDQEMDQMLGLLLTGNMKNKMAYEYLICYELLQKDLDRFMEYYPLGQYIQYTHIPKTIQEILIGNWMKTHSNPSSIPYSVDSSTLNNTLNFMSLYTKNPNSPDLNLVPYVNNAWHYMLISNSGLEKKGKEKMKDIY